ncbi:hypothetical protein SDC9_117703 [bioreactor metagenome]|uniref:Cytochrome b5 heme-binding domain-containing protein n=1 Tax=bioreactor metagenome TaxID=1076179 RepID=A0A645C5Y8_9ZZZZ
MWDEEGHRIVATVAVSPQELCRKAGFEIPADRKFVMVHSEGIGKEFKFSGEKLTTLLTIYKYEGEFENALKMMDEIYKVGGRGHSCGIYSFDEDHIRRLALRAPVTRVMVRQPQSKANAGSAENGTLELTLAELAKYNGKDGNPAYVAVDGIIYDVSAYPKWKNGDHNGYSAGNDLTEIIKTKSPHGVAKLNGVPVVGKLIDG